VGISFGVPPQVKGVSLSAKKAQQVIAEVEWVVADFAASHFCTSLTSRIFFPQQYSVLGLMVGFHRVQVWHSTYVVLMMFTSVVLLPDEDYCHCAAHNNKEKDACGDYGLFDSLCAVNIVSVRIVDACSGNEYEK
jgi:hypothetical protein